ncbi:hypothetical protein C5167_023049 [Papaver somniferum]|uniref:Uncharacterized protein n=1 Tax=Papaver somniferum TaxID=3469 RepID=A0A4Y7JJN0_PAPSO|nr:hypothetical protein C5167_023049 [Papaver somniferum]
MNVFVPNDDDCDQLSLLLGYNEQAKPWQMVYLHSPYRPFGATSIRSYVSSFGDQFDENRYACRCYCRVLIPTIQFHHCWTVIADAELYSGHSIIRTLSQW